MAEVRHSSNPEWEDDESPFSFYDNAPQPLSLLVGFLLGVGLTLLFLAVNGAIGEGTVIDEEVIYHKVACKKNEGVYLPEHDACIHPRAIIRWSQDDDQE